jgi:hypothetical protein
VAADISVESFQEMIKLLKGEEPLLLGATYVPDEFIGWLRANSPVTAVVILPAPLLSHENTWFVAGTTIVAMSLWSQQS